MDHYKAAGIAATRQVEAVMADIYKAEDLRKEERRQLDKQHHHEQDPGHGVNDLKTVILLVVMTVFISALTALAVTVIFCDVLIMDKLMHLTR